MNSGNLTIKNMTAAVFVIIISVLLPDNYLFAYSSVIVKILGVVTFALTIFKGNVTSEAPKRESNEVEAKTNIEKNANCKIKGMPFFKVASVIVAFAFLISFISETIFYNALITSVPIFIFSIFYEKRIPNIFTVRHHTIQKRIFKYALFCWAVVFLLWGLHLVTGYHIVYYALITAAVIAALIVISLFAYGFFRMILAK